MKTMQIMNTSNVSIPCKTNEFDYIEDKGYYQNIYDESRIVDFDEYIQKKERFQTTCLHWRQIPRANNSSKPLQEKALFLLSSIVYKLKKQKVIILNQNYLSRITKCKEDQNTNLLNQLKDVLTIRFCSKITIDGTVYRNVYVLRHTKKGYALLENSEVLLQQNHFVGNVFVPKTTRDNVLTKSNGSSEFFRTSSIYKEEVLENRSTESTTEANLNQKTNFNSSANITGFVNTKKSLFKKSGRIASSSNAFVFTPVLLSKHYSPNKRKTSLKSTKFVQIIKPIFYSKPKSLRQMQELLNNEIYQELRFKSGRDFSNNFISQKVLALSKKHKITASFKTKQGFISYMTIVLKRELHDAVKTSGNNFRFRVNLTAEDRQYRAQEKFLNKVEQLAISHVCPENQLKAKLAGRLEGSKAYRLLSNLKRFKVVGEVMQIHLTKPLYLTENDKEIVLSQAKVVYSTASGISIKCVERVEFVVSTNSNLSLQVRSNLTNQGVKHGSPTVKLPEGIWGEILKKLIDELGIDNYKNWFSELTVEIDEAGKTIILKAPSEFVKDWVVSNYQVIIERITLTLGFKLTHLVC